MTVPFETRRTAVGRLLGAAVLAAVPLARTDAARRNARIGFVIGKGYDTNRRAFVGELAARGYVEDRNLAIAYASTNEEAKAIATADLDLIVAGALTFAIPIRQANPRMPMVLATCPGMVSNGFARTLARPGGIYTGMDELPPGVTEKRLSLLRAAAPAATRVALLSTTPGVGGHEMQLRDAELAARSLGFAVKPYRATSREEVQQALGTIASDGMDSMLSFQGGLALSMRDEIVAFAAAKRLPAIYQATLFAEAGGLMTWAPDLVEQFREAGRLAAKVLDGAKPGDLPVRHPSTYSLTVNARAARQLGLVLPPALIASAGRIID